MTFYGIEVRADGRHQVFATDDGIRRTPVPTAIFGKPRDAIRYAEMRERQVSPLRAPEGAAADLPLPSAAPSGVLTGTAIE